MASDPKLTLLDMNISWPPDYQPFIGGRLKALAAAGVKVFVTTASHKSIDRRLMPFVTIIQLPSANEKPTAIALRTLAATVRAFFSRPILAFRAVRLGISKSRSIPEFAWWWAGAAPLIPHRVDVVHFEWNGLASSHDWLPNLLRIPYVVSCRGRQVNIVPHIPGQESARAELARTFKGAALVHGVCNEILREAQELGMPPEKGRVVYTSVDLDFFHPNPIAPEPDGPIRLLSVGVSMWRKGYEYLLLALRRILDRGIDTILEIADYSGPEQDRMEHLLDELNLRGRVRILGTISPSQVRDALWRSDIFVLPALSEGISNAVIEAMACGVPVITTECGGMREAVTDGVEGRVVPMRDVGQFAAAIEQLAKDSELRKRMGEAGRARAERQFGGELQARQFLSLYEEAVASYGTRHADSISARQHGAGESADGPSCSSAKRREGFPSRQNRFHIVTMAELHWKNGHEYALEAMQILRDRRLPFKYTIVGKGPFLEAVGFARYQLGLMEDVEIILDADQADTVLEEADLFLLASVADGAENGLEVAVDRGLPVVCTDLESSLRAAGGSVEIRTVTRRDPAAIADGIMEIVESIQGAKQLHKGAGVTLV